MCHRLGCGILTGVPEWTIRAPASGDVCALAALHVTVWRHAYRGLIEQPLLDRLDVDNSTARWRATVSGLDAGASENRVLIAVVDGEPVGVVEVGASREADAPYPMEVLSLNVAPRWHGRGVAQDLMARAVGDAPSYLWVLRGNDRAIGFYRKLGFDLDGAERYDDSWRCFDQRMRRPAAPA